MTLALDVTGALFIGSQPPDGVVRPFVYAVDAENGAVYWTLFVPSAVDSVAVAGPKSLLLSSSHGMAVSVGTTPDELWQ